MKETYLVLSDIHGNKEALDSVLEDFKSKYEKDERPNKAVVLVLGDTVDYGADSRYCIDKLKSMKSEGYRMFSVRGNHENAVRYFSTEGINTPHGKDSVIRTRKELEDCNFDFLCHDFHYRLKIDGYLIFMNHSGNRHNDITGEFYPDYLLQNQCSKFPNETIKFDLNRQFTINLFGHSHRPLLLSSLGNSVIYFNPGSVGQPRDGDPRASYGVIEIDYDESKCCATNLPDREVKYSVKITNHRVKYDIPTASRKIYESGRANKLVERLFVGE